MLIVVAMVAVVGVGGVEKAQAAPGFFSFSVGNPGYGPAGYSASFGTYPQALPYAVGPNCGPRPYGVGYGAGYGAAYGAGFGGGFGAVPYVGRPAYGAYYRPPVPNCGPYGHHGHYGGGYRGW
jgi:hypothetical protein